MELSNQFYLGNDGANPFYYSIENPLGFIDGKAIYEGDDCWLTCLLEDKPNDDDDDFIPF